jgi:hypothetical protein
MENDHSNPFADTEANVSISILLLQPQISTSTQDNVTSFVCYLTSSNQDPGSYTPTALLPPNRESTTFRYLLWQFTNRTPTCVPRQTVSILQELHNN